MDTGKVSECKTKDARHDEIVKIAQLHDQLTDIVVLINRRFSIKVPLPFCIERVKGLKFLG